MIVALGAMVLDRGQALREAWQDRPGLTLLACLVLLAPVCSAIGAHAMGDRSALFAIVDSYGAVPFLLLLVAAAYFRSAAEVRVLLLGLTVTGAYLAATAVLEGLKLYSLVFPRYIADPTQGLHFGRARGPFLEAGADGLAIVMCMVAAGMLLSSARATWSRTLIILTMGLGACGVFFTLTRSVWISLALVVSVALLSRRDWWKWWALIVTLTALGVTAMLTASPSLRDGVITRLQDDRSGVDRLNANSAAFEVLRHHPLTGVGWHQFAAEENSWLWQSDTEPLTNTGIAVHNVVLGYAAEMGLLGALLWVCMLAAAVFAVVRRSEPTAATQLPIWPSWPLWPVLMVVAWVVVSLFVPITYAFPSTTLWLFLGLRLRAPSSSSRELR